MADLSLIPKAVWHEAKRRAEMPEYEHGRPALPSAEVEFGILLKSTLESDIPCDLPQSEMRGLPYASKH